MKSLSKYTVKKIFPFSHPLLKSFIGESGGLKSFVLCDGDVLSLARVVVRTVEVNNQSFVFDRQSQRIDRLKPKYFH